jgi:hypothetical protein
MNDKSVRFQVDFSDSSPSAELEHVSMTGYVDAETARKILYIIQSPIVDDQPFVLLPDGSRPAPVEQEDEAQDPSAMVSDIDSVMPHYDIDHVGGIFDDDTFGTVDGRRTVSQPDRREVSKLADTRIGLLAGALMPPGRICPGEADWRDIALANWKNDQEVLPDTGEDAPMGHNYHYMYLTGGAVFHTVQELALALIGGRVISQETWDDARIHSWFEQAVEHLLDLIRKAHAAAAESMKDERVRQRVLRGRFFCSDTPFERAVDHLVGVGQMYVHTPQPADPAEP